MNSSPSAESPPALESQPTQPVPSRLRVGVRQALVLFVITLASLALYLSVEYWRGNAATIYTQTAWDRAIPFYYGWVWVYLFPYVLAPVIAALLRPVTFDWFIRRGILVVLISLVIFAAVPTRTVRPDRALVGEGITGDLYRSMADCDEPGANAAPSLHVSLTCLFAIALLCDFPRWRLVSIGGILVVWLSTLFTHQHHLIDVGTGILLALLATLPRGRWLGRAEPVVA
jgi:membrane-associated phospholipid phosphatase